MGLKKLMEDRGISQYRLAKEAGIGLATVSEILSGKRKEPTIGTCSKIAQVLDVEIEEVYKAIKEEDE